MRRLEGIPDHEERVLVATGRYVGEGFDDARLDTLFLSTPISWKGTLAQYVGRLHGLHPEKHEVVVHDYLDSEVAALRRMAGKCVRGNEDRLHGRATRHPIRVVSLGSAATHPGGGLPSRREPSSL